jgi:phage-related protein
MVRVTPLPLFFWRSALGHEPVRSWLRELPPADRHKIGDDLREVQFAWPVGMPLVRPLGQGLWEARSSLPSGRIARVLFAFDGDAMFLLHGFIKKTPQTPAADLTMARRRMKDLKK